MPRTARIKNSDGIYHIMIKSISEVNLFRNNDDRDMYMNLLKKYQNIYIFRVYSFCLLSTHGHLLIDSNGADISKIMKCINQSYAFYYNKKYSRHGHLFQDRFKSVLISNYTYLLTVSAYIHNNVKDINGYRNAIEKYPFSSLSAYLDKNTDYYSIVDTSLIYELLSNMDDLPCSNYLSFLERYLCTREGALSDELEFTNDKSSYISGKIILTRNFSPENILEIVSNHMNTACNIHIKYMHTNSDFRAICVLLLRSLCNLTLHDIALYLGNLTNSAISRLCTRGLELISTNKYSSIIEELIHSKSS